MGVDDENAERQLKEIYRPVLERTFKCPVHSTVVPAGPAPAWLVTTINSAELIKHASNSFLALKISYANMVCGLGRKARRRHRRSGARDGHGPAHRHRSFLNRRSGLWRLLPAEGLAGVRSSRRTLRRGFHAAPGSRERSTSTASISFTWKSFAARSGWSEESRLASSGWPSNPTPTTFASRRPLIWSTICSPKALTFAPTIPRPWKRPARFCLKSTTRRSPYEAAKDADALLIATEWDEFRKLDWDTHPRRDGAAADHRWAQSAFAHGNEGPGLRISLLRPPGPSRRPNSHLRLTAETYRPCSRLRERLWSAC